MKYINAKDILPAFLIDELQKRAAGKIIYIPKKEADKARWGEVNGTRNSYEKRNSMIRGMYDKGLGIEQLSDMYHLSCESIKKLVSVKKR